MEGGRWQVMRVVGGQNKFYAGLEKGWLGGSRWTIRCVLGGRWLVMRVVTRQFGVWSSGR